MFILVTLKQILQQIYQEWNKRLVWVNASMFSFFISSKKIKIKIFFIRWSHIMLKKYLIIYWNSKWTKSMLFTDFVCKVVSKWVQMTQQRGTSPVIHRVFFILLNRTILPLRQEGNLGAVFKAFIVDGYTVTAKWELKIRPTESYSGKNVYYVNKGINQSAAKCVKSLNSQGVKAFNYV